LTSHNSQCCSLNIACIDFTGCQSIQSAYLMLSHAQSLKGLWILRPFHIGIIQNHISEELCQQMKRTHELTLRT
ncbi:hypothetical protein EV359DRAFT_9577, partial [Lentinula novae-zelandiae]